MTVSTPEWAEGIVWTCRLCGLEWPSEGFRRVCEADDWDGD